MKLSDAILLGAMSTPQGVGTTSSLANSEKTCALGAAAFASGLRCGMGQDIQDRFPILREMVPFPPKPQCKEIVYCCVMALNDEYRWTREEIAGWVATLEAQQEVQAEVQRVAEPAEVVCA